jgi:hypothetical protein
MKGDKQKAEVVQILLWYDRPEIVLLKTGPLDYILAVSSGVGDNDDHLYIGASMALGFLAEYQAGKFDLRYALAHANFRRYWTFSFLGREKFVDLSRIKKTSPVVLGSMPDAGFFSREHHKITVVDRFVPDSEEVFKIDGSWELGEFSRFYGKVEDVYYIFNDIRRFNDPDTSEETKSVISEALDRPWRGGGSYVGYYDKIANDNAPTAKLRVSGIKYNSPGYVAIKAKKQPFDDMIALVQSYATSKAEVRRAYNRLYQYMLTNKLLTREEVKVFVPDDMRKTVRHLAELLDNYMPGISFDTFVKMSNNNDIVAAKVLLSVFRRMDGLYKFFEEGRVRYAAIDTDPLADDD